MHPLIADGGEMTVLRDLAAFSYGRWSVDWPESVPDEQRPELPDDRDFGYASKLKQDPGRFGRRFVRADVTIKAQDFDDAGKPIPFSGESDVEETLDDAAKRTDGDVFFEREITRAGLGALVPRVDFDVDSVVPVLIWGKTIPSPVTSIEDVVEQGAVVDYRVHVGGQLLQDDAARERANREVERTIAQERRERVKAVSKERKARTAAVAAESRRSDAYADSVASGVESRLSRDFAASYERYSKALTDLGDTWRRELQDGLSAEQQARVEALRQEQLAREKAGTDLRGQLERTLDDAVAKERDARVLGDSEEARARQKAISDLSQSFTTELQTYGELVKEAKNYVDPATQQVVNFWSKENQNNFNKAVQLTLSAQAAYNDVNNIKWVSNDAWQAQQEKINAQQVEIDAAQDDVAEANRKAADAAQKAADTAKKLATENGILLTKIEHLQGELDRRAAGSITAFADRKKWSFTHKKAIDMPQRNRNLQVFAAPDFIGSITVMVNYANGNVQTYWVGGRDMQVVTTGSVPDAYANACGQNGLVKTYNFVIALGSVGSATMIFDNVDWG
ncbi:hypothetical protein RAE03_10685 [Corynebacterium tuberculostearicum]|uniref:Immunity-specific protein beta371 n=1 Tax=Corynebacterium tuberculostearicum TaxID=38304 RepID=A0AAE4SXJ5_9CORY|nr:hypothetical protein [Corynebacterium tuberculostearicum]MDV2420229.1 hypothetical protein [Corynebacterium tuberculostearicum]